MNAQGHNSDYDDAGPHEEERAPARDETIAINISRSEDSRCSSPPGRTEKKSVRFLDDVTVHRLLSAPRASDMSPEEKSDAWYGPDEYDRFKYQAAKQAGVKIVRYESPGDDDEAGATGHHFVMCGDFDSRDDGGGGADGIGSSSAGRADANDGRVYYNENEYDDRTRRNSGGEAVLSVCRRGLGYHFSRSRKRSRIATRSAVVAWQRTLREQEREGDECEFPIMQRDDGAKTASNNGDGVAVGRRERSAMTLALVSTRCSRVSREEAAWRGDVDYRVAYPERHAPAAVAAGAGAAAVGARKRSGGGPGSAAGRKRQRRNAAVMSPSCSDSGGRSDVSGALSPTTIGYLVGGVLRAEAV